MNPQVQEENRQFVLLIQAMLGQISENVRMVYLAVMPNGLHIHVILEDECLEDREAIDAIAARFQAFQSDERAITLSVHILGQDDLPEISDAWDIIYSRKYPWDEEQLEENGYGIWYGDLESDTAHARGKDSQMGDMRGDSLKQEKHALHLLSHEENFQLGIFVQALLANMSGNFRAVYIAPDPDDLRLHFVLEEEDPIDRAAIDDIVSDFYGYQLYNDIDATITVNILGTAELPPMSDKWLMVYVRKAPWKNRHQHTA